MYSAADKATGFATASATVSGVGWLTSSTLLSTVGTLLAISSVIGTWLMLRKEKQAELANRQEMKQLLRGMAINQVEIAAMVQRLEWPKQETK